MRQALSALWATFIVIFQGIEEFGRAFKSIGEVANEAAQDFKDEEAANRKIRRLKMEAEYQEQQKLIEQSAEA
ncbi:MAG: hypothetical protein ACRBB6_04320 [Neptuniibacter sp.]